MEILWRCKLCGDEVESDSLKHHQMNYCKCKKSAVDLEEGYMRGQGSFEIIKRFGVTSSDIYKETEEKIENNIIDHALDTGVGEISIQVGEIMEIIYDMKHEFDREYQRRALKRFKWGWKKDGTKNCNK